MDRPAGSSFMRRTATEVAQAFSARAAVLPVAAVCALLTARLQISHIGISAYAAITLIATLPALIPVGDLGIGAAVTNAVADDDGHKGPPRFGGVLISSVRVLAVAGAVVVVASLVLGALGVWVRLLGLDGVPDGNTAATVAFLLFGVSMPLAVGHRVLLGLGKNHVSILLQGAATALTLALTVLGIALGLGLIWFAAAAPLAVLVAGASAWVLALRRVGITASSLVRSVINRAVPGAKVRQFAIPMATITLAQPIAYQSDRIVLSHVAGLATVALYSVASQVYVPLLSLVTSSGQTLWPSFARARADATAVSRRQFLRILQAFVGVGLAGALMLVVLGRPIGHLISAGEVVPSFALLASFGLLLVTFAAYYPAGMLMTDAPGLRFQAYLAVTMAVVNVPLSIVLANAVGVAGPVLASSISIAVCMLGPAMRRALREVA